jgi:hypothetical protein
MSGNCGNGGTSKASNQYADSFRLAFLEIESASVSAGLLHAISTLTLLSAPGKQTSIDWVFNFLSAQMAWVKQ